MLFDKYRIGHNTVKNSMVRSAVNDHLGNPDGSISEEQIQLFEALAEGGVGTIITGHFGTNEEHKASVNQPLLTDDRFIDGARRIADAVHPSGCLIYGQISNGGLKAVTPFDINIARESELEAVAPEFGNAALRLKKAGFDGVQIHLAHGYFFANVLDNTVNLRNDQYGGSDEARFSLVRKTIQAVRKECGDDFSIIVKLSANNIALTSYEEHLRYYAAELGHCRIDAIEVSGTDFAKQTRDARAYYLDKALMVKEAANVPVMLVGGIYDRETMENVLKQGIDMISCARPFICEPDFATRLRNGAERSKCVRCWQCFKLYDTKYKNCVFLPESEQLKTIYGSR